MCTHHHNAINRRHLGSLLLGVTGAALMPAFAYAADHKIKALCVTCIDYRFLNKDTAYVANDLALFKDADIVALAGASLSGVSEMFKASVPAFWEQVGLASKLHGIGKIVVIDHRDCGAFNAEYGVPPNQEAETQQHLKVMTKLSGVLKERHKDLAQEFYLMPLEGCAERMPVGS
jgi:carbonic anhydrase